MTFNGSNDLRIMTPAGLEPATYGLKVKIPINVLASLSIGKFRCGIASVRQLGLPESLRIAKIRGVWSVFGPHELGSIRAILGVQRQCC